MADTFGVFKVGLEFGVVCGSKLLLPQEYRGSCFFRLLSLNVAVLGSVIVLTTHYAGAASNATDTESPSVELINACLKLLKISSRHFVHWINSAMNT